MKEQRTVDKEKMKLAELQKNQEILDKLAGDDDDKSSEHDKKSVSSEDDEQVEEIKRQNEERAALINQKLF